MNKTRIKKAIQKCFFKYKIKAIQRVEKKRIHDPRRKKILEQVILTENQKNDIEQLFIANYNQKLSCDWHRLYSAYTGNFDKYYFPEILYTSLFEMYMNQNNRYKTVYSDKAILGLFAESVNVKMPQTILVCVNGQFMSSRNGSVLNKKESIEKLKNVGEVFIKPTIDSNSGQGCFLANFCDGIDNYSGKRIDAIVESMGLNFVVQERLECHESISRIYSHSVNTLRITSYKWNGEILHMPIILRIGQGGNYLDNAHAGGIFIALDDDGRLHKKAFSEFNNQYTEHPDTGFVFENNIIYGVDKAIQASIEMHKIMPEIGIFNFDFTLDKYGDPVLIEANCNTGGVWLPQIAHGKGAFGELTPEILRYISFMKSVPFDRISQYQFGNMN